MSAHTVPAYARPNPELSQLQADWLRGGRVRLLRAARILQRRSILDLGAGWGHVARELADHANAEVTAVDALTTTDEYDTYTSHIAKRPSNLRWIQAHAEALPLANGSCDLVFTQCTWLWLTQPTSGMAEVLRVLAPGGAVAMIEPDYGGLIEYPHEIALAHVWQAALARAGADPCIGRKLPSWFRAAGLDVTVFFADRLEAASSRRFEFLLELPLDQNERAAVLQAASLEHANPDTSTVHLPFWFVLATLP